MNITEKYPNISIEVAEQLQAIYNNEPKIYDEGKTEGIEQGKQAEYDAFWDALQNYGKRTESRYLFFGTSFVHIDPKYFISASNADSIFCMSSKLETVNWDKFDLSASQSLYNAFGFCEKLKRIDTDLGTASNVTGATVLNSIFRECSKLEYVKKIKSYYQAVWKNSFDYCYELVHITFDGVIGQSGLNLQWSTKLSKASIESVISALDLAEGRPETTVTLSLVAVNKAFETIEGANDGASSANFGNLCASARVAGWTISLV